MGAHFETEYSMQHRRGSHLAWYWRNNYSGNT